MKDHKIEAAYLRINGTGYREGDVAKTIEVTPSLFVDLLADGRIAGIESLAGAIGATELLRVLHSISTLPEIAPPTPAEPEPGAYLIGGVLAARMPHGSFDNWICAVGDEDGPFWDWEPLWRIVGGPDVTIQPLVPMPEVDLPCNVGPVIVGLTDGNSRDWSIYLRDTGATRTVTLFSPERARLAAAALWKAAGGGTHV